MKLYRLYNYQQNKYVLQYHVLHWGAPGIDFEYSFSGEEQKTYMSEGEIINFFERILKYKLWIEELEQNNNEKFLTLKDLPTTKIYMQDLKYIQVEEYDVVISSSNAKSSFESNKHKIFEKLIFNHMEQRLESHVIAKWFFRNKDRESYIWPYCILSFKNNYKTFIPLDPNDKKEIATSLAIKNRKFGQHKNMLQLYSEEEYNLFRLAIQESDIEEVWKISDIKELYQELKITLEVQWTTI